MVSSFPMLRVFSLSLFFYFLYFCFYFILLQYFVDFFPMGMIF